MVAEDTRRVPCCNGLHRQLQYAYNIRPSVHEVTDEDQVPPFRKEETPPKIPRVPKAM